jgi:hypothetical protein
MDPVEAQPRQVYFFDTPDLQLVRAGLVVRARRIAGGKGDTVVKLRPVEPGDVPPNLRNDPAFKIEVDALPGGFVCSASFKGRSSGQDIRDAVAGRKKLSKLFSKAQRAFYSEHAPAGVDMDSLVPLGPTFVLKGSFATHMGIDGKSVRSMTTEVWLYPDGSRILELSTKAAPNNALAVATEARAYLVDKGVPTNAAQETKSRTARQFYSKALQAEMAAAPKQAPKPAAARPAAKPAARDASQASAKPNAKAASKASAKAAKAAKAAAKTASKTAAKPATRATRTAANTSSRRTTPPRTPPKAS